MDVKSARRTIDLFEAFARAQGPLSLSELARVLNAPASSCFNLVRALEERGYLYAVRPRQLYPTRRLFDVARAIVAGEPWMARLERVLQRLRDRTQETVILGKRQGDLIVYLDVIEGPQTIRYTARAGDLKLLHSSSIGKAFLGALDPAELPELLKRLPLERVTAATITDRGKLLADIERGQKRGYFMTAGENVADVMAIAAAARLDADFYGIAIAGPMHRMAANLKSHVSALKQACATIREAAHERTTLQRMA